MALDKNNQFTPTFATYCSNWMKIIYQLLWYVKDIQIDSTIIKSLELAALAKLNQLHANKNYDCKVTNLKWNDESLILQPFPEKSDINGNAMDITLQSYQSQDSDEESDSKDKSKTNNNWFANKAQKEMEEKEKEKDITENEKQVVKLLQTLNEIESTYNQLDVEIEKIEKVQDRKQIQDDLNSQMELVKNHITQAQLFQQQLPTKEEITTASTQAVQLARNQEVIGNEIIHVQIKQAKEFLEKHSQQHINVMDPTTQPTIMTSQQQAQTHNTHQQSASATNNPAQMGNGQTTAVQQQPRILPPIPKLTAAQHAMEKQVVPLTPVATLETANLALADSTTYTKHSKDLYANRKRYWTDRQEYKEDKDENECINLKFTAKEDDVKKAAVNFIKNIQTEAETLIARGVFSEQIYVRHIIYKCLKDDAFNAFSNAKGTKLLSINPTTVSEIVTFMKVKYHLVDYIEKVKKEFENFNPKKYPWLEIVSEFELALQQYCIVAKACGLEGQYDTEFSDKYLVTTLKDRLPMTLRKYIKKIRWESATAHSTSSVIQQQKLKLPEAKTLEELNNLIIRAKENYDFDNDGQQQPHIDHGFKLNAIQQRDRSRYPPPQYPQSGKPNFNPSTTPRNYGKPPRGSNNSGIGRARIF